MKRDQRRRRVPRKRKQKLAVAFKLPTLFLVWQGYARKRRRLPRPHRYSTKVDRSLEPSFDDGFDEVVGSHRCAARGEE